jgi:cysteine desulfurase
LENRIYFDNAATTSLEPKVLEAMLPYFTEHFGNPSSIYSYGRDTRAGIETARKTIAKILNAQTSEIIFTSGGTEANNMAIKGAVNYLGSKNHY